MLLEKGATLLADFSNDDHPIVPADLGKSLARWTAYEPIREGILPFMVENQGVCVWAISLHAPDDPPVLIDVDSGCPPRWQRCADRFSDWLNCQVWDHQLLEGCWFGAQAPELSADAIAVLNRDFDARVQTHAWPGRTNYRYSNPCCEILLWNSTGQSDWWIKPMSADSAIEVIDELDHIAAVGRHLYSLRPSREWLLDKWKARKNEGQRGL
jgi:hypothetical protein